MTRLVSKFWARVHQHGLHGRAHIVTQRRRALILISAGFMRAVCWLTLGVCYIVGLTFARSAFASVSFVALMSCYANAATDFGQGCASLADLSAGDAHQDAEQNRVMLSVDVHQLEQDIARLAALNPGPEARNLSDSIRKRIKVST